MKSQDLDVRQLNLEGKGLGFLPEGSLVRDIRPQAWNLLKEDVSLPVAVLRQSRIEHNLNWMRSFIQAYGAQLAPHGKTTMSPALFHMQLNGGAWGITLATAPQVQAAWRCGVRRVIMANQLVGKGNMDIIARLQAEDASFSFCTIVDSAANVEALGAFFAQRGQTLRVMLEYGVEGGRTGIRNMTQEREILQSLQRWPDSLHLIGVEVYEGVLKREEDIRTFLRHALERTRQLAQDGFFMEDTVILTGAGSAWYDVVAEEFSGQDIGKPLLVVLRPGCYLTHDVGIYREAEQRIHRHNKVAQAMNTSLLPALQLWAYVQSRPEPGRAIIALGKRDAAFDAGLPIPSLHYRPTSAALPAAAPAAWHLSAMMDQHAFMDIPPDADLAVGDILAFEISHPCLTFDKWRNLLLIDDDHNIVGLVETLF